jgi:hypothetical protein
MMQGAQDFSPADLNSSAVMCMPLTMDGNLAMLL